MVRMRYASGTHSVRNILSWYSYGTHTVRGWYAYGTHAVRKWYAFGTHYTQLVRNRYAYGTHTVRMTMVRNWYAMVRSWYAVVRNGTQLVRSWYAVLADCVPRRFWYAWYAWYASVRMEQFADVRNSPRLESLPVFEQLTQTKRVTPHWIGGPASGPALDAITATSNRVRMMQLIALRAKWLTNRLARELDTIS